MANNIFQPTAEGGSGEKPGNSTSSGRQKVRVFLEGREVPVKSVTAIFRLNMPSMANIELVPLAVIKFIKPRTQVHIFVQDTKTFGDSKFYLCFEGEVMGRSMIKRHDGRGFRITAYDYTNYWDDTKAFVMNPNFIAGKLSEAVLYGEPPPGQQVKAEAAKAIAIASNTNSLMVDFLVRNKENDGVTPNVIKGVKDVAEQLAFVNEFYRAAYERLRVNDRMDLVSSGGMAQFLRNLKVHEFLTSYTGQMGGMVTLRQMLMSILALFFHEELTVPFPSLLRQSKDVAAKIIKQFIFIPDMYPIAPPKCNVIFPSQQNGFEFDEDFKSSPTRYGFRVSFPIISDNTSTLATYPIRYYPPSFSDYMMKGKTAESSDLNSMLGPSTLIDSKSGSYGNIYYGEKSKGKAVVTSYTPTLKESDYVSNEESFKGIFYDSDVLAPAYSSLIRGNKPVEVDKDNRPTTPKFDAAAADKRNLFMSEIGKYLFFKKRYTARKVSASITFNPFLVPGFNSLFIDNSDAGQSFFAKIDSISHTMTNEGFISSVGLSLARDFDEVDIVSGGSGEPPLPKWFDPDIYGTTETKNTKNPTYPLETKYLKSIGVIDAAEEKYRNSKVTNPTVFPNVSEVYQQLLGCNSITGLGEKPTNKDDVQQALVTTNGAAKALIQEYNLKENQEAQDEFIRNYTRRPVVSMEEAFYFIGAKPSETTSGNSIPSEWAKFDAITDPKKTGLPGRFDGTNYSDETVLKKRRSVIDKYILQLQTNGKDGRGYRG
jgi:hypothetical protein